MDNEIFNREFFDIFFTMHSMAMPLAKTTLLLGGSYSFGKNVIRVALMKSKMSIAISDFLRDMIIYFGIGYLAGGIGIGRILTNNVDAEAMRILRLVSTDAVDWVKYITQVINGISYSFGSRFSPIIEFVTGTPTVIFGLSFGLFSGLLSKK